MQIEEVVDFPSACVIFTPGNGPVTVVYRTVHRIYRYLTREDYACGGSAEIVSRRGSVSYDVNQEQRRLEDM